MTFPKTTKLSAAQRSAIRAGAQSFASRNDLEIDVQSATWAELQDIKKSARIAARDVLAEVRDGMSDAAASSLEKAQGALLELADLVEQELDARTARNSRGPSNAVDLSKRPEFEARSCSAVDGGSYDDAPEAYALENRQSMKAWAQARDHNHENVSAGAFLRALTIGARNDAEQRALAGGTDAAGGYTVPTLTSSDLIDMARSEMVLTQAGARIVPLTTDQTVIAKVLSSPSPAFRAENSAVTESDPTFGAVTLAPKSIAVMVKASIELMEDSVNLEQELPLILARALAVEIDRVGLVGSGTGNEPKGIVNYTGLTTNTFAGGALTGYAPLINARGALHGANEKLSGFIMARTDRYARPAVANAACA